MKLKELYPKDHFLLEADIKAGRIITYLVLDHFFTVEVHRRDENGEDFVSTIVGMDLNTDVIPFFQSGNE